MRINIVIIVLFCLSLGLSKAQNPSIQWQKSIGGTGNDKAYSMQPTSDGGYIIAGLTNSNDGDVTGNHGGSDFWVVKLNALGGIQWQKTLGGSQNDDAKAIAITSDGGYIIAGSTKSNDGDVTGNHGNADFWIVKLNNVGVLQWQKSLGGTKEDVAYSIIASSDGGCIATGYSFSTDGDITNGHDTVIANYDIWVVKLDVNGGINWQKSFGGKSSESANVIHSTFDKGYVLAGYSFSNDGDATVNRGWTDFWVIKLDSSGTMLWQKSFGGTKAEEAYDLKTTADGGYIIVGNSGSNDFDASGNHGGADVWVVKLDANGDIQWQKSLGGAYVEFARSVQITSDDGYIIACYSGSADYDVSGNQHSNGTYDYWLVKLSIEGKLQWQKCFGGTKDDDAFSLNINKDGSFMIAGFSESTDDDVIGNHGGADFWIINVQCLLPDTPVVTKNGNILYSSASFRNQWYKNDTLLVGDTSQLYDTHGQGGIYKVRTVNNCGGSYSQPIATVGIKEYADLENTNIFPNPVTNHILNFYSNSTIDLIEIFNTLGQKVLQTKHVNTIDIRVLPKGMYSIKLTTGSRSISRKVFVE